MNRSKYSSGLQGLASSGGGRAFDAKRKVRPGLWDMRPEEAGGLVQPVLGAEPPMRKAHCCLQHVLRRHSYREEGLPVPATASTPIFQSSPLFLRAPAGTPQAFSGKLSQPPFTELHIQSPGCPGGQLAWRGQQCHRAPFPQGGVGSNFSLLALLLPVTKWPPVRLSARSTH